MTYKFTEKEVIVKSTFDLGATLTLPETSAEKLPAIVIIGGTGKGNRDGNMKNFNMNIYKKIAEFLSELGFVTIRYDKRGIAQSKGDHLNTGVHDLVEDVISNIKYLESLPYVDKDRILLLGHSEGCILSTIVNTQYPVSGLILLAGAGTSIKTAMESQNFSLINEIRALKGLKGKLLRLVLTEKKLIAQQNKIFNAVLNSTEDVIKIQLQKFPAKWLRQHLSYTDDDVMNMLRNSTCPILVITGDKDVQADSKDLEKIEALNKQNIVCKVIPNMDHVLGEYKGEKSILNIKKQYKSEFTQPLHYELMEELEKWCLNTFNSNLDRI